MPQDTTPQPAPPIIDLQPVTLDDGGVVYATAVEAVALERQATHRAIAQAIVGITEDVAAHPREYFVLGVIGFALWCGFDLCKEPEPPAPPPRPRTTPPRRHGHGRRTGRRRIRSRRR